MTTLKLVMIPGGDVGKEVVSEVLEVLGAILEGSDIALETTNFDLGADYWHHAGDVLTEDDLGAIKTHDAVLLSAVGDPSIPSDAFERGLLLELRFALDHYVSLYLSKHYKGVPSPLMALEGIDFIVVRKGAEGLYCGDEGAARVGTPQEVAVGVSVNTAFGVECLVRFAFEKANARPTRHLTFVYKHNVLVDARHLRRRTVETLGAGCPEVRVDYCHVDAATIYMVSDPQRFDIIVTNNLFSDILADEAGAVTGGIGFSVSGNINPEGAFPSIFEPVHGSVPDVTGQGKADPTATVISVALFPGHVGRANLATKIEAAIESNMTTRAHTTATGAPLKRSTSQIGDTLVAALN